MTKKEILKMSRNDILKHNNISTTFGVNERNERIRTFNKDGSSLSVFIHTAPSLASMEECFGKLKYSKTWDM